MAVPGLIGCGSLPPVAQRGLHAYAVPSARAGQRRDPRVRRDPLSRILTAGFLVVVVLAAVTIVIATPEFAEPAGDLRGAGAPWRSRSVTTSPFRAAPSTFTTWVVATGTGTFRSMFEHYETPSLRHDPAPANGRPQAPPGADRPTYRDVVRAVVPTATIGSLEGDRIGVAWLDRMSHSTFGQALLVAPSARDLVRDGHVAAASQRHPWVTTSALRGLRRRGWRGGPVLLLRPNAATVGWAERTRSARAICVVEGVDYDPTSWGCAFGADDLTTGRACPPGEPLDPLVETALRAVRMSKDWRGLSTHLEAARVTAILRALASGEQSLDPDALEVWALRSGWRVTAARKLHHIAEDIGEPDLPTVPDVRTSDVVEQWTVGRLRALGSRLPEVRTSRSERADRAMSPALAELKVAT